MALDVHLQRVGDEDWGFEILGGADEAPLRVEKVEPNSPADKAALQNGDTILSINGAEAIDMSRVDARRAVAECGDILKLGVMRGLYDPVLDDQEPIIETFEPGDSDLPSEPTEVPFKIQQFIEAPEPLQFLEPSPINAPSPFTESRSLTSSPFLVNVKPYRPFSTEPILEVPPLEEPIILNPNYKDQFGFGNDELKPDELLGSYYKDAFEKAEREGKFKLPVSEQYDPEGKKMKVDINIEKTFKYIKFYESMCNEIRNVSNDVKTRDVKTSDVKKPSTESVSRDKRTDVKESILKETKVTEKVSSDAKYPKERMKKESHYEEIDEEMMKEELKYIEKMKQEIDIDKIEETALSVVDESIERAVSVAEEIKQEIDNELSTEEKESVIEKVFERDEIKSEKNVETVDQTKTFEHNYEAYEDSHTEKKTCEDKTYEESHSENIEYESKDYEYKEAIIKSDKDTQIVEHKPKYEDSPRRGSRVFEETEIKEQRKTSIKEDKRIVEPIIEKEYKSTKEERMYVQEERRREQDVDPRVKGERTKATYEEKESKEELNKVNKTVHSAVRNEKSEVEQRIYAIGLQTIPNIRGVVHSSYHYDLLLKTFFIHLTDVMVALSRFIITQPVFNTETIDSHEVRATHMSDTQATHVKKHIEESTNQKKRLIEEKPAVINERKEFKVEQDVKYQSAQDKKAEAKKEQVVKPVTIKETKQNMLQKDLKQMKVESVQEKVEVKPAVVKEMKAQETVKRAIDVKKETKVDKSEDIKQEKHERKTFVAKDRAMEVVEKRKVTGSSMAQLSEKKLPQDLTQKMDAVVAEFQTKATADSVDMVEVKKQMVERRRRSRSRSQVEEEVMRESDPLEWLAKVDSRRASQERMEVTRKDFSSTSETMEKKRFESSYEKRQTRKHKPPKQMYVAIVEAHVYTNKDAIFEEQVSELSETSSIQSAEEINTAFEAIQMESTENVTIENAIKELESAKTLVEESYLDKASAKSEATVEMIKETVQDIKEIEKAMDFMKEDKAVVKNEIQEVVVQETKEIIEPVIEIEETKYEKVDMDISQSLTTAESHEVNVTESKKEFTNVEEVKKETVSIVKEDYKESAVTTEMIADDFTETAQVQETELKYEVIKPEYQIVEEEEVTERVVIKSDNDKKYKVVEASAELKIVKELEIESQAEIIEIEDENELVREGGVDAQSVINKLQILKALEVEDNEITEKSMITTDIDTKNVSQELAVIKQESELNKSAEFESMNKSEVSKQAIGASKFESRSAISQMTQESQLESHKQIASSEFESQSISQLTISGLDQPVSSKSLSQHQSTNLKAPSESIINKSATKMKAVSSEAIYDENSQESSFTAKSVDKKLSLQTDLALNHQISVHSDENNNIDTPTPSTVPPTPLVDEYIFKLTIPLPKSRGSTPVPRDCTPPSEEDPHIVKKKLIPYIETTIEEVVYDCPLPTPPGSKVQSPVYTKPGLRGGADRPEYRSNRKEEIREIERKSSLLASAIDETIKSIEEYKEEVGIETKKNIKVQEFKSEQVSKSFESSHSKKVITQNGTNEIESKIEENKDQITKPIEIEAAIAENSVNESFADVEESTKAIKNVDIEEDSKNGKIRSKTDEIDYKTEDKKSESGATVTETAKSTKTQNEFNSEEKITEEITLDTEKIDINVEKADLLNDNNQIDEKSVDIEEISIKNKTVNERQNNAEINESKEDVKKMAYDMKIDVSETKIAEKNEDVTDKEKPNPLLGFRPVVFDPEAISKRETPFLQVPELEEIQPSQNGRQSPYLTDTGDSIGTIQGIVDGLEETVIDPEVAKELGKPGIPEEKIAELISGESEMLREAHVMGLSRVLNSHMHRVDDSVDFQKIKPMIDSLKDSEVLKALNEDLAKAKEEEKKKEEKKWTKFLQKPKRPVPKAKFGYQGWTAPEREIIEEPYTVKIVKQPKPKVAPDYKPEDFDTGPLPWEEREVIEASLPPIEPEEPILVPEEGPEFLEAVDPLPESEVPDLEDTGIPLPPIQTDLPPVPVITQVLPPVLTDVPEEQIQEEIVEVKEEKREEMDNTLAEQLVRSVQSMVDPNATLEQQLAQMRAQLAALAQLPGVIQQTLELVTKQLSQIGQKEAHMEFSSQTKTESYQQVEVTQNNTGYQLAQQETQQIQQEAEPSQQTTEESYMNGNHEEREDKMTIEEMIEEQKADTLSHLPVQEMPEGRQNTQEKETVGIVQEMNEEENRTEKQKKSQLSSNQDMKQQKPRACKPQPKFGPLSPEQRAVVLPGGRRWRNTQDVYNEQLIAETLSAQAELIQGKALGINFMKYEKPPVSLDHLQRSEVYKVVHNLDQEPLKRVELRTPVIAEADYRKRCRSVTPSITKKYLEIPQQFHP